MAGPTQLGRVPVDVQVHVARGRRGRRLPIIEGVGAVAHADDHEAAATDVARRGMDHRQGEPDGDRRVDRVPSRLQYVPTDLTRQRAARNDHCRRGGSDYRLTGVAPLGIDARFRSRTCGQPQKGGDRGGDGGASHGDLVQAWVVGGRAELPDDWINP